ncbi:tyrosine-type recombinase/integrase [Brevibacillus borstelensis]|uniref:tyrosine-type recombinase/integrase n=1 Tax=Brevibacillus borstelensis TaxID=45462 RepID=UPI003CC91BF7
MGILKQPASPLRNKISALRHTHAVHLLEAGANIKYVSERLGHASVKVTADTYLHVTKKLRMKLYPFTKGTFKFRGQSGGKAHFGSRKPLWPKG